MSATTPAISLACVSKNSGLCWPHQYPVSVKILACVSHNSSNITGRCQQKFWPASPTSLTCVSKNTGLCQTQLQEYHCPVSAKILACVGHITNLSLKIQARICHNTAISLACVITNSGLHRPQQWHMSASTPATSLACVSKNTGLHWPQH